MQEIHQITRVEIIRNSIKETIYLRYLQCFCLFLYIHVIKLTYKHFKKMTKIEFYKIIFHTAYYIL